MNLGNLSDIKHLRLPGYLGSLSVSPDKAFLYVLANGNFKTKTSENVPSRLHVVSLETMAVTKTIDAEYALTGAIEDRA